MQFYPLLAPPSRRPLSRKGIHECNVSSDFILRRITYGMSTIGYESREQLNLVLTSPS
ncbi:hypothetical protein M378DRAFT_531885 [Amanita muscaria Koide BX008]|uniref:Uncharacterized protein n=1 Tax=Amanita muscaria (strain Koide BX008) TaxID=946122 RepID=A0A0C2SQF9_AMAMK|nr:hypothetical protein M378DRAFT_531885 [Amanita muscaria Koide BX008]